MIKYNNTLRIPNAINKFIAAPKTNNTFIYFDAETEGFTYSFVTDINGCKVKNSYDIITYIKYWTNTLLLVT